MLKMLRKAKILKKQAKDSRILELESWLCKAGQGSYLSGSDRRLAAAIAVLAKKPTPFKRNNAT